jgi:docosahexaenoic acid omega-hydroxylase
MCDVMIQRSKSPWLWIDPIFRLSKYGKIQNKCLKVLHDFTRSIIRKRADDFQSLSGDNIRRVAFLDVLLQARLDDPESFTFDDIQEEVDTFMFEGHDTTKSAINWTFYAIATNQEVQKKIHEEIDQVIGESNHTLSVDDLNKFEYLESVIKESLRIFPPVPMVGRELSEDVIIDGKQLLKGTQVTLFIYQVHRDERVFSDPEKFKPDRFSSENTINRHPYFYIPFSAGKRNCIGQRFAMMEIKVALVKLLRKYELYCDQKIEDIKLVFEVVLRNEEPILFTLKPRIINTES